MRLRCESRQHTSYTAALMEEQHRRHTAAINTLQAGSTLQTGGTLQKCSTPQAGNKLQVKYGANWRTIIQLQLHHHDNGAHLYKVCNTQRHQSSCGRSAGRLSGARSGRAKCCCLTVLEHMRFLYKQQHLTSGLTLDGDVDTVAVTVTGLRTHTWQLYWHGCCYSN